MAFDIYSVQYMCMKTAHFLQTNKSTDCGKQTIRMKNLKS